jgi:hypothetical protein
VGMSLTKVHEGDPLLGARAGTGHSRGVGQGSAPPRPGKSLSGWFGY